MKRYPGRRAELVVFATTLLATQNVDFDYLLNHAKEQGLENKVLAILLEIDKTLAFANPDVEDVRTLQAEKLYQQVCRRLLKSIQRIQLANKKHVITIYQSPNEIVE